MQIPLSFRGLRCLRSKLSMRKSLIRDNFWIWPIHEFWAARGWHDITPSWRNMIFLEHEWWNWALSVVSSSQEASVGELSVQWIRTPFFYNSFLSLVQCVERVPAWRWWELEAHKNTGHFLESALDKIHGKSGVSVKTLVILSGKRLAQLDP